MARRLEELKKQYARMAQPQKGGPGMGPRGGHNNRNPKGGKPKNMGATIKRMLSYVSPYKIHLIIVAFCMLLSSGTSLIGSYMLRPIINDLVRRDATISERLIELGSGLLVLGAVYSVGVFTNYFQGRLMLHVSQSASATIRKELFDKIQTLPVRFFDSNTTGETMSRFTNDVDNIDMMLNNSLTNVASGIITLIGTFVMMLITSPLLTIITIVFIPIFTFGGTAIAKRSGKYYGSQQSALGAVNGYIEESVSGQKVVKVFNHEEECIEEFELLNADLREKQLKAQFYGGIMGPVMGNTSQINYAVTAGVGGLLCIAGKFDVGGLSVFVNYSRHFSQPINMLSMQTSTLFAALAGAERVFNILDMEPEKPDESDAVELEDMKGDVELKNVTFGYEPDRVILKNISLFAHPGQKIAFVGSTGAGKTTVTNLLNRFYDIAEGEITIDGVDIKNIKREFLRKNIAMVLQDTHLFTGTIRENIRYGRLDATDEEVEEAARLASAHSFIMRLENGYDTEISGDGANLSQGQRQLLNIARAAISKAPILVLDEATSSVDTRTERHIEHGMDRLMKNRTTFVIAHRLSTVRNSNAIMVLEKGEIIERGSHDDLLALKGRYYELYTGVRELD